MSSNGNQVPLAPSQRGPGSYPRASTPHRPECYHPTGATGAAFMPSGASGGQVSAQAALRVQQSPQPSAPPAPQQDMSKTTMSGYNFVPSQNPAQQSRPQYSNFPYRPTQHGSRPNTHPRPQQAYMPGTPAAASGPMMYHPAVVFQPTHMNIPQSFPQQRSTTPGYYQYMPYLSYSTPPSHTPPYYSPLQYQANSQQLPAPNLPASTQGSRTNPTTMVGPQGTSTTVSAPTATLTHPPAQAHLHQSTPNDKVKERQSFESEYYKAVPTADERLASCGYSGPVSSAGDVCMVADSGHTTTGLNQAQPKRRYRLQIINPLTKQEVITDSNDSQYNDSSERQTPQLEGTHSIAEEFTRMVSEVAKQPTSSERTMKSNYTTNTDTFSAASSTQPLSSTISSINNNIVKTEILPVNENKILGTGIAAETSETPVVSAISNNPVIVPKMPMNIKQLQKNNEQNIQSLVIDNKNLPLNKQPKQKSKPVVPQVEESIVVKPLKTTEMSQTESPVVILASMAAVTPVAVVQPMVSAPPMTSVTPMTPNTPVSADTLHASVPSASTVTLAISATQTAQPPRIERMRSEEKEMPKDKPAHDKESDDLVTIHQNGPTPAAVISSADSLPEAINSLTSHSSKTEANKKQPPVKQTAPNLETDSVSESKIELTVSDAPPTATQLLSASIEKLANKEHPAKSTEQEVSSAIQAQAKLTQSIASCIRNNQPEAKMRDINLNNKTTDSDTANGNSNEITTMDTVKEDVNRNEKTGKKNKKTNSKAAEGDSADIKFIENGKNETDQSAIANLENADAKEDEEATGVEPEEKEECTPAVFIPKYKYTDDQWSPLNTTGKKCYDILLLKQIKEDQLSKTKPDAPLLETVIRTTPMQEPVAFAAPISRSMNDALFPNFFPKSSGMGPRNNPIRDAKKDSRNMNPSGKGGMKLTPSQGGNSGHKPVIHVSLSQEVKLNESNNAWKPTRFNRGTVTEEEFKTEELYKKFRGILNKLTPQKFDTLIDRVKTLEINNQKRLEGVIDLVFEKAIDEPNFSEAYAAMCKKLCTLMVPADNATTPDQCVNFRGLIITKCQNQFVTDKVDENILKLEKEINECTDPVKKKELQLMHNEESRRVRMRSVGNVRFIGELYKLKMLTAKIMVYCMTYLIDKLEEEKLECLCKLLTTIGEQVESEVREQLDNVFRKMQEIAERKSNKISSRVRFMIQDVIELRRKKWATKSVVDSQPKMMDQIQKEAEQQQRHIELMNAAPMGGFRGGRDDGGRGKRGDGRRQNSNSFMDNNNWKTTASRTNYTIDTSKFKAASQKNLSTIKLAPTNTGPWNHGSGTKTATQTASNSMISLTKSNMYSILENDQADPSILRGNKDLSPSYHSKGASIERSTFNSRPEFNAGSGGRSGSMGGPRSNSGNRSASAAPSTPPAPKAAATPLVVVQQEPLPEDKKKTVKSTIMDHCLINPDPEGLATEIKLFAPQYHAALVTEILNVALEKTEKEVDLVAKSLLHLVSSNILSADNFIAGLNEAFEFAPDLYIDIPKLYEYLGKFVVPQIEKKNITLVQVLRLCDTIIQSNHGHLLLKAIIMEMKDSMGPTFVRSKWQESGLELTQWMSEDQVPEWLERNKFEFLEGVAKACEEIKNLSPTETQSKLLELMNSEENCDCIRGWVQDNLGKLSNEDWFMRSLIQAICEHALFGPEGRDSPHFSPDRMNKYCGIINDFGESKEAREASCLFGIQKLIHRLEHPQGLTLEIFQYLHDQYIISVEGFIAWEESEKEPEGKGVMLKALTSFFTNIKEADNEDTTSED